MDNFRIPRKNTDLQEYVDTKRRKFAIKYSVSVILILLIEIGFLFDAVSLRLGFANSVILAFILLVSPFFIFGGHKLLLDKAWEGEIILFDYGTELFSEGKTVGAKALGSKLRLRGGHSLVPYQYCDVYVETTDKKTVIHRIWMTPKDHRLPIKIGTRLRKYKGLPYPVILGNGRSECPICGRVNNENAKECIDCRYSIIKTE